MKQRKGSRLRAIGLLMLLSILVLGAFVAYWLANEWTREKAALEKELSSIAVTTRSRLFDSAIVQNIIRPLGLSGTRAAGGDRPSGAILIDSSAFSYGIRQSRHPVSVHINLRSDTALVRELGKAPVVLPDGDTLEARTIRVDSFTQDRFIGRTLNIKTATSGTPSAANTFSISEFGDSTVADTDSLNLSLARSLKLFLSTLSNLPTAVGQRLENPDTAMLRNDFERNIRAAHIPVTMRWAVRDTPALTGELRMNELTSGAHILVAGGYRSVLLRQIAAQLLFSAFLLFLTAFAFILGLRAIRAQLRLAAIRNDFISNMSHELRTPVTTVKVALEAVSEPAVLSDRALTADYLEMARLELGRLELLINQVLQSAVLEGGQLRLDMQRVDIAALATQMLRIMQTRFRQAGGRIAFEPDHSDYSCPGDLLHLQGVVVNILDNALKYGGPAPVATMSLRRVPGAISLRVSDHGPGIPDQYRLRVFDKFFRVPRGNEHSIKGYGLGLNYAAQIMQLHGGTITYSETPGGGATFTLLIPQHTI